MPAGSFIVLTKTQLSNRINFDIANNEKLSELSVRRLQTFTAKMRYGIVIVIKDDAHLAKAYTVHIGPHSMQRTTKKENFSQNI